MWPQKFQDSINIESCFDRNRLNKDVLEGREREIKNVGTRMGTSRFTVFRRIMVYEKVQTTSRGVVGFVFFKKRHDQM